MDVRRTNRTISFHSGYRLSARATSQRQRRRRQRHPVTKCHRRRLPRDLMKHCLRQFAILGVKQREVTAPQQPIATCRVYRKKTANTASQIVAKSRRLDYEIPLVAEVFMQDRAMLPHEAADGSEIQGRIIDPIDIQYPNEPNEDERESVASRSVAAAHPSRSSQTRLRPESAGLSAKRESERA